MPFLTFRDDDAQSLVPRLGPEEGFVVLIPTLDTDSKLATTQPNYPNSKKLLNLEKKEFKIPGSLILHPSSFEIGRNHLLPYCFSLKLEEWVPIPHKV